MNEWMDEWMDEWIHEHRQYVCQNISPEASQTLDFWSPPLLPWVRHRQRVVEGSSVELVRGSESGVDSTIIVLSLEAKGWLLALLLPRFQQDQQRQARSSLTLTASISKVNISVLISLTFAIFFSFAFSGFCFIIRLLLLFLLFLIMSLLLSSSFLNIEKLVKSLKLLEENYWVFCYQICLTEIATGER